LVFTDDVNDVLRLMEGALRHIDEETAPDSTPVWLFQMWKFTSAVGKQSAINGFGKLAS